MTPRVACGKRARFSPRHFCRPGERSASYIDDVAMRDNDYTSDDVDADDVETDDVDVEIDEVDQSHWEDRAVPAGIGTGNTGLEGINAGLRDV